MKKLFILLAAAALVVSFSVSTAMAAAEWNFYGSARMSTFWFDTDNPGAALDDDGLQTWDLQGNSRVGAKVNAGAIAGHFEYGVTNQTTGAHEAARVRLLYGTWDFGPGKLLVGKAYTPGFILISNQVWGSDNDLLNYGAASGRIRQAQVALHIGGLKLALVEPKTTNYTADAGATWVAAGVAADVDNNMPLIEASYDFAVGPAKMALFGGYHSYDIEINSATANAASTSIDTYVLGAVAKTSFGPIFLNGSFQFGQNLAAYGWSHGPAINPQRDYNATTGLWAENDVDDFGFNLVAGFKMNDMITFEAGYGYAKSELDSILTNEDTAVSYYVNATINLAKGCFIVPEIGKVDQKDIVVNGVSAEEADTMYFGAKWQINF
jgi:hypothetical protein